MNDSFVKIIEVGPRDGLQNEKQIIALEDKVEYIRLLAESGLKTIECTSFVSPKFIPQMADSKLLYDKVRSLGLKDVNLPCLVPNKKGMDNAIAVDVKEVALFSATSNDFTKKNINATVDESFVRMKEVAQMAKANGIKIRGYISTVFGCPYKGDIPISDVIKVTEKFLDLGVYEISFGDTIGVARPKQVSEVITALNRVIDTSKIAMHFHDTRGMAIANILTALNKGIVNFDSSSGGLGGCPYANGATGNVTTEEVLYLLEDQGLNTGVDLEKVKTASEFILGKIGKCTSSKYLLATR